MLLAGAAAVVFVRMRDPVYVTTGMVMVGSAIEERNPDTQLMAMTQGLAQTYVRLAQYGSLPNATMQALGMDWLPEYSIDQVPNSQLIQITVTDTDPRRAQVVASELMNQLMALSPGSAELIQREEFAREQLAKLEDGIRQAEASITQLQDELTAALSARQIRLIEERVSAQEAKLTTLRADYIGLLQSTDQGSANSIRLVDAPSLPATPVESNDYVLIFLAALLGLGIAAAGVYLLEMLDDRLRDVEAIQDEFGITTLASIPESTSEHVQGPLIMVRDPHTMAAESFRVLRTNLQFASVDRDLNVLLITSPGPGDGKSYVSSNTAIAFAQTGKRVVLIDADLRMPTIHRLFGLLNNSGVTTALVGDQLSIENSLQPTTVKGLSVMTSGPLPPNPAELLTSNRMQEMLKKLTEKVDLVIVDSPPVTVVSDTATLAGRADGVLLVLPADNLGRDRVRHSLGALNAVKAPLLGAVINRATSDGLGFYYSYHSDYGNRYYKTAYGGDRHEKAPKVEATPTYLKTEVLINGGKARQRYALKPSDRMSAHSVEGVTGEVGTNALTRRKGATQTGGAAPGGTNTTQMNGGAPKQPGPDKEEVGSVQSKAD